jgi:hypothetical protein
MSARMTRTVLKLAIVALLLHASWRSGMAAWRYYNFKDEVRATAQFSAGKSESELQSRVLEIAARWQVPVDADHVAVRHDQNHTTIDAVYTEKIEFLPTYRYPWEFKVNVDAFTLEVPKVGQP